MARIGIVGLGFMGTTHLGAYGHVPEAEIAVLCDQDAKRAAGDFSDVWGNLGDTGGKKPDLSNVKGVTSLDELLAMDDVDVIDICLPTPFHTDAAIAALAAGKHVLCEKPMARTSADAQKIADAAAKAKGLFMPAMCMRFWPQWVWLKQAVESGRYGRTLSTSFFRMASMPPGWFGNGDWSGGALLDLHIHDTDFVQFLFGMPAGVFSRGYSKTTNCIDHVSTQYLYEGTEAPAIVSATGGWCMSDGFAFRMRAVLNFENATVVFDLASENPLVVTKDGKEEPISCEGEGFSAELNYFLDCIKHNRKPETVTAEDAVNSIRICEAEARSVESGQVVTL